MPSTSKRKSAIIPPDATFISAPQVCTRYGGRSHMWLERKLKTDPNFPRPTKIGNLRFFKITDLEKYECRCAAGEAA
jgi:predicted DNA-binding transcriptional regulator AlpA